MTAHQGSSLPISVVGGVYRERCMRPAWKEIYGSAGRAASAMASMGARVNLHTYADTQTAEVLHARAVLEGFEFSSEPLLESVLFDYDHGLATPRIQARNEPLPALQVTADQILRFGLIEADAVVHGKRVVYDPQDAYAPRAFQANGSTAQELALILNRHEAALLTGLERASPEAMAQQIIDNKLAQIVVIKQGPLGALIHNGRSAELVPAYHSRSVWKIGSGDNFGAHFAYQWMHQGKSPRDSADLASRATAYYCQARGFATPSELNSFHPAPIVPSQAFRRGDRPTVYLAGPFFTLAQLWLIEQARNDLSHMGLSVFSPFHDVGHGSAEDVVKLDLEAIDHADLVFAVGDGLDSGTIYEIGFARAKGKPVLMYCENESSEDKKMMEGSDCTICSDYVSAIYQTLWIACSL